jgi:hypothetical protein
MTTIAGNLMNKKLPSFFVAGTLQSAPRYFWHLSFCLMLATMAMQAEGGPAFPLSASSNGRYLVDTNKAPCLMVGDAPHSLVVNLDESDAATYLLNRGTNGFNSLWVECLCDSYTGGSGTEGTANYGHDINNNNPFTGTLAGGYYDLTTPNPAYWANVDWLVQAAATNGLQLMLTPLDEGGWTQTSLANGTNGCFQYGQFLGNRYKNSPNIFWNLGNDFQNWSTPTNDAVILAIANGIKSVDTNHLMTIELNYQISDSLTDPNWASEVSVDGIYTYYMTYAESLVGYKRTNYRPCVFLEANYEFEDNSGQQPYSPLVLRLQEYWSLLSGSLGGHMYGNHYTWTFTGGWQSYLNTTGAMQLAYFKNFFTNTAWYNLVPDQSHALVTAGYGLDNTGENFLLTGNNYVTAAQTPDGTLGVAYCPTNATITVCLTNFGGPVTARWFDPTAASFSPVTGSPFANTISATNLTTPGANAGGDHDWVLLLQSSISVTNVPPAPTVPTFVQESYATPQSGQTQVTVAYPGAQTAGDANLLAIGWDDTVASISTVTDSAGNVYQAAVPTYRGNGMSQALYYAADIKGGTNAVTVTFNQAAAYVDFRVTEYSGMAQTNLFEAGNSGNGTGTSTSSGNVTTTNNNVLLFGAGYTTTKFTAAGTGFTARVFTSPDEDIVEDMVASTPGSYAATAPETSGTWIMQVAAFNPAATPVNLVAPQITAEAFTNNEFVVSFSTVQGQSYELQSESDLTSGLWSSIVTNIAGTGSIVQAADTNGISQSQQFYRVETGM